MNPWKIIGWIFLAFLLYWMYSCGTAINEAEKRRDASGGQSITPAASTAPAYVVEVISVECDDNHGRNRADITVLNTGRDAIPYAKVFFQFTDASGKVLWAEDSYFSPTDIPPGAMASATLYADGGGSANCGPTAMQDGDGNRVVMRKE